MKEQTREDPKILAAAERQMQAWAINKEIADRSITRTFHQAHGWPKKSFLAISREAGAGGSEIAAIVGKCLGWEVLDKNLLDQVAERFRLDRSMLDLVDETRSNWVYDVLGTWMDSKVVSHETYVSQLSRVILAAARQANLVIVGRGAGFLLPREKVLAVRLLAPEPFRLKRIVQFHKLSQADARRFMREIDQGRREFVQRFFHHDITDPHLYDLVINTERMGIAGAAAEIVAAVQIEQPATV
jgi:cytidylate kinase